MYWFLILLTCAVNVGCSVTIELYSMQKYSGLLTQAILHPWDETLCNRLDQTYEVRSIKTEKCVILYETEECNRIAAPAEGSKMYSVRIEKDTPLFEFDAAYANRKEEHGVQSFRLCGTVEGGGLLNVDIYSGPFYTGDLVASYGGVCECRNIPSYTVLKEKPFSIDNHGNNMYFYDKEDCTGRERFIPAGDHERSRSVFRLDDALAVVIRSFRPADGLRCPNLSAEVNKFTFHHATRTKIDNAQQYITYKLKNTQHTSVIEYLDVAGSLRPLTVEYSVAKPFTRIHTTELNAGFVIESENDITTMLEGSNQTLQRSLKAHYQYRDTNQNTPTIVTRESKAEWPQLPFELEACQMCTATITLTRYQAVPISYTAEAIVKGMAGDDRVSAEQIRYFLPPGMKYVRKIKNYMVMVVVEGEMKGIYRDRIWIEKSQCGPVPDC